MRAGNHFIALLIAKLYNYHLIDLHARGALVNKEIKICNNILLGEINELGETGINCYVHKGLHSCTVSLQHSIVIKPINLTSRWTDL